MGERHALAVALAELDDAYRRRERSDSPHGAGHDLGVAVGRVLDLLGRDGELMGAAEAAEALGVQGSNLRKVSGLPEPVARLRSGPVWLGKQIRDLAERRAARGRGMKGVTS